MSKKNKKDFWRKLVIWLMLIAMVGSSFTVALSAIFS
jgi:hypothetical protein